MAEVRKHGQGGGGHIAAAIERAMASGVRPSGTGAPPEAGQGQPSAKSTQHLVTASSFLTSDPFLIRPKPAGPAASEAAADDVPADDDADEADADERSDRA
ncbi:hypothetical protein CGZ93_00420 [Enemella dayhoffiae]|uniref:Uncharacterized protein n=1 Tax=Enemella dayhoffiae TaxID=2016507 RepID=A0A255HBN6_9ACTN|nr:hypothetical protein [Enemella dayhoffiae]OYO24975.1 hypothetical protein CGZ93_00420 [Enemella dayhoffiae]